MLNELTDLELALAEGAKLRFHVTLLIMVGVEEGFT